MHVIEADWGRSPDCDGGVCHLCHGPESDLISCAVDLKLLGLQSECLANTNGCAQSRQSPEMHPSGKGFSLVRLQRLTTDDA
jgi:hypothetical protein